MLSHLFFGFLRKTKAKAVRYFSSYEPNGKGGYISKGIQQIGVAVKFIRALMHPGKVVHFFNARMLQQLIRGGGVGYHHLASYSA